LFAAKVRCGEFLDLEIGSHSAVKHDNGTFGTVEAIEKGAVHGSDA
jgi:hypothetical protein